MTGTPSDIISNILVLKASLPKESARFGTTPRVVQQRLKLAVVSPKLIALYRKGDMTLDCLMAFTVSDDHKQQEKVWAARPKWGVDPDDIAPR